MREPKIWIKTSPYNPENVENFSLSENSELIFDVVAPHCDISYVVALITD